MSVLLDTNVVSELMRKAPGLAVQAWADGHTLEELFFSAVGEAELRCGAAILPAVDGGNRWFRTSRRCCGTPSPTAYGRSIAPPRRHYADTVAMHRSAGRPIAPADCQVAAIARSRSMAMATPDVRDFEDIGIKIVNPWTAA